MMAASTTTTTTSSIIDFEEQIKADDYLFEQQLEDQMSSLQLQHHPLDHLSMSLTHQQHHQHQKYHHRQPQPSYQHQSYDFQYGVQSTEIAQRVNLRTEDDNGRPGIGLHLEVPDSSTIFSSSSFSIADNDNNNNNDNGNDDNMKMMLDPQVAALLGYPLSAADSTTSSMITAVNNPVMLSNGTNIMYHKNNNHSNNERLNNDSSSSPTNIAMRSNYGIASPSRVVDPSPSSNSHQQQHYHQQQHHQHQHHIASVGFDDPLHSLLFDASIDDPSLNSADYVSTDTAMPALSFAIITILITIIIITIIIIITTINTIIFINYSSIILCMIT
jgi:hypothetical protein